MLALGCLAFKEESGYRSFFSRMLQPFVHYVPFWVERPQVRFVSRCLTDARQWESTTVAAEGLRWFSPVVVCISSEQTSPPMIAAACFFVPVSSLETVKKQELLDALAWAEANDEAAKKIAREGQKFVERWAPPGRRDLCQRGRLLTRLLLAVSVHCHTSPAALSLFRSVR